MLRENRPLRSKSTGNTQVARLGAFALFVGLALELYPLSFVQRLQAGVFDRSDVHEYIASTIVRLDEAVATLAVEEFDRTGHRHRHPPSRAQNSAARGSGAAFTSGEKASAREALFHSAAPPQGERNVKASPDSVPVCGECGKAETELGRGFAGKPVEPDMAIPGGQCPGQRGKQNLQFVRQLPGWIEDDETAAAQAGFGFGGRKNQFDPQQFGNAEPR